MGKGIERLLLGAWREACQHIEIGESIARIAALLADDLPSCQLIIRAVNLQHQTLETLASASVREGPIVRPGRTECPAADLRQIVAWAGLKSVLHSKTAVAKDLLRLLCNAHSGDCMATPLSGQEGRSGVLLFLAAGSTKFDEQHLALAQALAEPFSAALENDRRLHELAALREAAEADRRALLNRLGRKEVTNPIIGVSGGLEPVMERVETVSRSDVPVLLLGETGTGKEVIARAVHDRSARHDQPFIRVNCGAIPSELIDSQLFGHERGSFTGAAETHKGWFERADRGTLFLDEIAELTPAAQVRLLRVLQDGIIERVGGKTGIHVDVRVVAATHRDLAEMIRAGAFRQDLWYRIAVFPIPLPPLRERIEDIPALSCHFAEKAAQRFGLALVMPTPQDIELLSHYSWPGNIRELASVIDRAALLGNGKRLEVVRGLGAVPTISERTSNRWQGHNRPPSDLLTNMTTSHDLEESVALNDAIRVHIENALRATHGRVEGPFGAARRLKINPHTLRSRMRKLGIRWRDYKYEGS